MSISYKSYNSFPDPENEVKYNLHKLTCAKTIIKLLEDFDKMAGV